MIDNGVDETVPATGRPMRRLLLAAVAAVVVLLLVLAGFLVLRPAKDPYAAQRKAVLRELASVGAPGGFTPAADEDSAGKALRPAYDSWTEVGSSQWSSHAPSAQIGTSLGSWLTSEGFSPVGGDAVAASCGPPGDSTASQPEFTCGNFLRETAAWRVWVQVMWGGAGSRLLSDHGSATTLTVNVQPRRTLAAALQVPTVKGKPALRSPGLAGTVPAGQLRVLIDLPEDAPAAINGGSFDSQGQLVLVGALGGGHGAAATMPALMPVAAGGPVQQLTVSQWPTLAGEASVSDGSVGGGTGGFPANIYAAQFGPNGDLWLSGDVLRRFTTDGRTVNVMGAFGLGPIETHAGPALGQPAFTGITAGSSLALTADGSAWLASDALLRVRDGIVHIADTRRPTSVVSDGANGVYFTTSTQLFHRAAGGSSVLVAGTGASGQSGDGAAALKATFGYLTSVALAKDGSLFVLGDGELRRIRPGGTVTRVLGASGPFNGESCVSISADAPIDTEYKLAASPLGGMFIVGCNRLVQVGY